MQIHTSDSKKAKKKKQTLWLTVFSLIILVGVTGVLVGNFLYSYARKSDCVISLYQGSIEKSGTPEEVKKSSGGGSASATGVQSSSRLLNKKQAEKFDFKVVDDVQVWSTDTSIDIFKMTYQNQKGKVTVRSGEQDKVIAPGTGGSYTFSLKNTGEKTADCKVWVEAEISSDGADLPVQTKMSGKSGWLLGSDEVWGTAEDLNEVSEASKIPGGKSLDYTIYWQWPYEREEDEADTVLGNLAENDRLTYEVTIHTLATAPEDILAAKTGDETRLTSYMLWTICAGILLIIGIGWKRCWQKKLSKVE